MPLVEALRPFMVSGERVEIGAVVDLGQHAANMMIAANKARPFVAQPEPEPKDEPAPARRKSAATNE
jgi:hypothetical protein